MTYAQGHLIQCLWFDVTHLRRNPYGHPYRGNRLRVVGWFSFSTNEQLEFRL